MMKDVHGKLNPGVVWQSSIQQVGESFDKPIGLKY
jgi:hypothetical protein